MCDVSWVGRRRGQRVEEEALVAVHCTHGVNRTGFIVCRWLMEAKGWDKADAINAFQAARGHTMSKVRLPVPSPFHWIHRRPGAAPGRPDGARGRRGRGPERGRPAAPLDEAEPAQAQPRPQPPPRPRPRLHP